MKETEKAEKNLKGCGKNFNGNPCGYKFRVGNTIYLSICPECKSRCLQHKQDCEDFLEETIVNGKEICIEMRQDRIQTINKYQTEGI